MDQPPSSDPSAKTSAETHDESPKCRVVVFAMPDGPEVLSDCLENKLGMNQIDARIQARAVPGILPAHFTQQEAVDLVEAAFSAGVVAEAIGEHEVPRLDRSDTVHHARCGAESLEFVGLRNKTETSIPWSEVRLLSIGYIPLEQDRRRVVEPTGIVTSGRRTWAGAIDVPSLSGPEAWLIFGNGDAVRIDHNLMNYEYLAERKTESATRNFRAFVEDIAAAAKTAYLTPATRAYIDHGLHRHFDFRSSTELQHYTQFHLLLAQRTKSQGSA